MSEYDNYEYDLKKEGVTEERTDGAYISVNDYYHDDHDGYDNYHDDDHDGHMMNCPFQLLRVD